MTLSAVPDSHQLSQPAATVGIHAWQLEGSRATSLRVRHASELMVSSGRVWATLDGPHGGPVSGNGDLILMAGARLALAAGQRVVIEPLRCPDGAVACVVLQRQADSYALRDVVAVLRGAVLGALRGALAGARAARAASSASRAQGAMACGESMASSGAL